MKIKIKENLHLLWLLLWPVEIGWYSLLNNYAREMPRFFTVHSFLDDLIPFVPFFVVFYIIWYVYIAAGVLYFGIAEKEGFAKCIGFLYTEMFLCLLFCTVFPNGHDFRPVISGNEGIFHFLVNKIYEVDFSCTSIMPSMHVMSAIGITAAFTESPRMKQKKCFIYSCWILTILISLSTVFIKQHSALDVIMAVVFCIPLYLLVYKTRFPFFKKNNR